MSRFTLPAILTAAALAVGCAGTITTDPYGYAGVAYTPDLITVSPGVSVVAGYHEPVFYSNNRFWRYGDYGRWYSSRYYDRGWTYATPPRAVLRIDRPYAYRNYRPRGYTVRRDPYRGRTYDRSYDRTRQNAPVYRDRDRDRGRDYDRRTYRR